MDQEAEIFQPRGGPERCFFWSSSTYNQAYNGCINIGGQDSHTETFSELHQFRSSLGTYVNLYSFERSMK